MTTYVVMKTSGEKIGKLRRRTGLSQTEFAAALEVGQSTVSSWEKDENFPKLAMLKRVARLLRCTMDYLLDEEDEREPDEIEVEMKVRSAAAVIGWWEIERRLLVNAVVPGPAKNPATPPVQGDAGLPSNITVRKDLRGPAVAEIRPKDPAPREKSERPNHSK
jgi:transcriptional regulator with XRE-family HTH domain